MASNTLILSLKISLLSLTILSIAILIKIFLPELLLSGLWGSLRSWLTPPYLYVVINFIIISIAASSRYQNKPEAAEELVKAQQSFGVAPVYAEEVVVVEEEGVSNKMAVEVEDEAKVAEEAAVGGGEAIGASVLTADEPMILQKSVEASAVESVIFKEKPPVSARFGRKIPKGGAEGGKSLKVSKPKRQDTLESTWKMITEGRPMPLARHLKKSDTWETHNTVPKAAQMKHSETFNSRDNVSSVVPTEAPTSKSSTPTLARSQGSGSMKLKKEPSLSQDELNRRVEAFINKFNEEMRLQRLESLNRYKEMVV